MQKTKAQISWAVDQQLCFRFIDNTTPLLLKCEIPSLYASSEAVQPGLCGTWSETPMTGFLMTQLILYLPGQPDSSSNSVSSGSSDTKAIRKGLGIQDSEVTTLEYVKNKIASCMTDDGPASKGQGQVPEQGQGQQVNRGQQHLQVW